MRWWLLGLGLLACTGDPVGEAAATGGGAGSAGSAGSGAASGSGGTSGAAGSGGLAGTSGSGGSAGGLTSGVLDPDGAGADGIAVDETFVYYGKSAAIWRVDKTGGIPQSLTSVATYVREVAVDDQYVYFLEAQKIIRRAPKAGGDATLLVQGAGSFERFGDIATDGEWVYYSSVDNQTSYSGSVRRVKAPGGVPETIHTFQNAAEPLGIYLYGGEIYWTNHLAGQLFKKALDGGSGATLLGSGANKPRKLAANDTHLFWTETDGSLGFKTFGGTYQVVDASGPGEDIVIDDSHVFFSAPSAGRVYATSIVPDTAAVVAECNLPGALAIDALAVYVACAGSPGSVLKIAK